jgi:5'-nucleotidase
MRRASLAGLLLGCLLLSGCARAPRTFTLSLVGTNDLHGGVLAQNGRGGLALLGGYLANVRAARQQDHGSVLLLDAGDLFQGTLESNLDEGRVVVDAYNALGYQAATIGNHEFDYGPVGPDSVARTPADDPRGALKARLAQAHFPWVAANVIDSATRAPIALPNVTPSVLLTVDNVRVGIVGVMTEPGMTLTAAANVVGLTVAPIVPTLIAEATRLRADGATIVIALAHAGARCARLDDPRDLSSCEPHSEIFEVVAKLPAGLIDAVVAGHRHEPLANDVNGVPIIQSWWAGRAFGRIDLTVDRASGRVVSHHLFLPHDLCARVVPGRDGCATDADSGARPAEYEGQVVTPSASIAALLQPAVDRAAELKRRPLGSATITDTLLKSDFTESPVGDLEADWMKAVVPGVDVALTNSAGLRADLPAGPFTYGRLYALLPFDNQGVVLALTGAQLKTVIAQNLARTGSLVTLSGVRAAAACANGQLAVSLRRDSGATVGDAERLTVITTDFLATGGDSFFTPVMPLQIVETRDVLRNELAALLTRTGGRWGAERLALPPRISYPGARPVSCAGPS